MTEFRFIRLCHRVAGCNRSCDPSCDLCNGLCDHDTIGHVICAIGHVIIGQHQCNRKHDVMMKTYNRYSRSGNPSHGISSDSAGHSFRKEELIVMY